ncbi:MAG: hypothetical protein RMJ53_09100 [Chitinophagales bacterium]|nr:hypothetical protein [Chitinophagales bacterium]MDW8274370.1 hypothetical protein [Chitinophagales bacterium]
MSKNQYNFLKRKYINDQKWNECVERNSDLPYALTWYLDCVADNWSALVLRDYEAVFPIVWKKKLGIQIVYTPFFCQQLGLFTDSNHPSFESTCIKFLQRKFLFCDLNLHYNSVAESSKFLKLRYNYILPLNQPYEKIAENYSKNTLRNLAKCKLHHIYLEHYSDVKKFSYFYEKYNGQNIRGYNSEHTRKLERLIEECIKRTKGEIVAVYTIPQNPPVALLFYIKHQNRIINLAPVTLREARETGGMFFIIDSLIRRYAETNTILDFEGSSIESIARFYKGFGAKQQNFWTYRHTILDTFLMPFYKNH